MAANTSYPPTAFVNGNYAYLGVSGSVTATNWTPTTGGNYTQLSVTFTTGNATTVASFRADITTLHGRGQHVILSVVGEKGNVSVGSSAGATDFATSVHNIMTSYGFDGVEIDLENGLSPTFMAQALRSLSATVGPRLIITMAPQTIDMQSQGTSRFQLALSVTDILTIVNTQYYDSGSMLAAGTSRRPTSTRRWTA